jgi:hypothetical protein
MESIPLVRLDRQGNKLLTSCSCLEYCRCLPVSTLGGTLRVCSLQSTLWFLYASHTLLEDTYGTMDLPAAQHSFPAERGSLLKPACPRVLLYGEQIQLSTSFPTYAATTMVRLWQHLAAKPAQI